MISGTPSPSRSTTVTLSLSVGPPPGLSGCLVVVPGPVPPGLSATSSMSPLRTMTMSLVPSPSTSAIATSLVVVVDEESSSSWRPPSGPSSSTSPVAFMGAHLSGPSLLPNTMSGTPSPLRSPTAIEVVSSCSVPFRAVGSLPSKLPGLFGSPRKSLDGWSGPLAITTSGMPSPLMSAITASLVSSVSCGGPSTVGVKYPGSSGSPLCMWTVVCLSTSVVMITSGKPSPLRSPTVTEVAPSRSLGSRPGILVDSSMPGVQPSVGW